MTAPCSAPPDMRCFQAALYEAVLAGRSLDSTDEAILIEECERLGVPFPQPEPTAPDREAPAPSPSAPPPQPAPETRAAPPSPAPYTPSEVATYYRARAPKIRQTQAKEWRGPCPLHGGVRDSFAVQAETGLWHCHSECGRGGSMIDFEMALSGAAFKDAARAVDELVGRHRTNGHGRGNERPVAEYTYTDEHGTPLFRVVRFEPKNFRQKRWNGSGWEWGLKDTRRVLYRLPEVLSADVVRVAEGERDVDNLCSLGLTATCNPMGAGKWRDEYAPFLRGKRVFIYQDNDPAGRAHALQVAESLVGVAAEVRVVIVPTGKDVSDYLASGATRDALLALEEQAPIFEGRAAQTEESAVGSTPPPPEEDLAPRGKTRPGRKPFDPQMMDGLALWEADMPEPKPLVEGLLYRGLTLLAGRPKSGKSWAALDIALGVATGRNVFGSMPVREQGAVLYCDLENSCRTTKKRLKHLVGQRCPELSNLVFARQIPTLKQGGVEVLDKLLSERRFELVVVDTVAKLLTPERGRDLIRSDYFEFDSVRQLAERHDCAVLAVHHTRKADAEYSPDLVLGTTGVTAAPDCILVLTRRNNRYRLSLTGRDFESVDYSLGFQDGRWTLQGEEGDVEASYDQQEVLDLFAREGPGVVLSREQVTRLMGRSLPSVDSLLHRMVTGGLLARAGRGKYQIPYTHSKSERREKS